MSLFRKIPDSRLLADGNTDNWGQSIRTQIPRLFHLEGIGIHLRVKAHASTPGTMTWTTGDYWSRLLNSVRFEAQEGNAGTRTIVDCEGPILADWNLNQYGFASRQQWASAWSDNWAAGAIMDVFYNIPFTHPLAPEPIRSRMALPLKYFGSDPTLTLNLATKAQMATAFGSVDVTKIGIEVRITPKYREINGVLPNDPRLSYIRTELISQRFTTGATGRVNLDLVSNGILTGLHCIGYTGSSLPATRVNLNSSETADEVSFEWKSRTLYRDSVFASISQNGLSQMTVTPSSTTYKSPNHNSYNSFGIDFLSEDTNSDIGSFLSCVDLNPETLEGSKARLVLGNSANASYSACILTHRVLGKMSDLVSANTI